MGIYIPKGSKSGTYYYEFVVRGQRFKGSTETANRREAERIERDLKAEAKANARAVRTGVKEPMTLLEAITAYTESKGRDPERDPNAAKEEREFERMIARLGGPDVLMRDITTPVLDRMVKQRTKDFRHDDPAHGLVSGATVNRTTWQLFRRVYLHARDVEGEVVPPVSWPKLAVKEAGFRTRELKLEEENRFEEHLREGYGAAYRFAILSGMRCRNCIELRWREIDLGNREIKVVQKGGKEHTVAIDDQMMAVLLAERGRHPEQVFTFTAARTAKNGKTGETYNAGERYPLTFWGFQSWFRRVRAKVGVPDLRIHDLRRTAASRLLRGTGNLKAASELLGHSDIGVTARAYAHVTPEDRLELQNKAHEATEQRRKRLASL